MSIRKVWINIVEFTNGVRGASRAGAARGNAVIAGKPPKRKARAKQAATTIRGGCNRIHTLGNYAIFATYSVAQGVKSRPPFGAGYQFGGAVPFMSNQLSVYGGGVPLMACSSSCNDFCTNSRNLGGSVERSPVGSGGSTSNAAASLMSGCAWRKRTCVWLLIVSTSAIRAMYSASFGWSGWLGSGSLRWLGLLMSMEHTTE